MRNFFYTGTPDSTVMVDFLQLDSELVTIKETLIRRLLSIFETADESQVSPSEERTMDAFKAWYHQWTVAGARIKTPKFRFSNINDIPANSSFVYVNCNTGQGLVLLGYFDDGYGDRTDAALVL